MTKTISTVTTVEKEAIEKLNFPKEDVLLLREQMEERRSEIEKAMRLGNMFKGKVKIVFEDSEGLKMVETTIWSLTDKNIVLKNGILLPIHRVHSIAL
jgi:hypothetical protein